MASKKQTRRALFMSIVSLILCCAMLVGTTFAWFTDSVTSGNNVIAAGNLDVALYHSDKDAPNGEEVTGNTKLFDDVDPDLWEPGAVAYENFKVVNEGTLALKYRMSLKTLEQSEVNGYKLGDVIKVGFKQGGFTSNTREGVIDEVSKSGGWKSLTDYTLDKSGVELAAGASDEFGLVLYWAPNDNETDNHYNVPGKALYLNVGVELYATQVEAEEDSFGDDYDEFADLGEAWDGETKEEPKVDEETGVIHITNAAELVAMMEVTGNSIYSGKTIVLDDDINLGGATIKGIGDDSTNFAGIFDGQGHAIGNFKIDASGRSYYAGLFNQVSHGGTVKNLTVKGATVIGTSMVGAVASSVDSGTVTNCKAIDCTLMGVKKVGSVIGYSAGGTVTNNYAENCTIYYSEKEAGEVLGFENTGSTVTGNTAKNITIQCRVSNADELAKAVANGATDIELNDGEYDVYDCAGKTLTISGSKDVVIKVVGGGQSEANGQLDYGFDGSTVTFNGVTIKTNNQTYAGYARLNGVYNNCTFENTYCLNGTSEFNNCTFNISGDQYSIWTWGAPTATFDGCTFNTDGKAVLLYGTANTKLTVNNCVFNDNGGLSDLKAAIEIGNDYNKNYELIVNNTTVNGYEINDKGICTYTTLWANKNSMGTDKLTVTVDGVEVYGPNNTKTIYIGSADALFAFAQQVNEKGNTFSGKTVVLTADIDLENKAWTPIGQTGATEFKGTFDGQNYTIKNLNVDSSAETDEHYSSGLFGWVEGKITIKNVKIDGAKVVGNHYVSALVGYTYSGQFTNCHVANAEIICNHANDDACGDKCGLIVGYAGDESRITDCSASDSTVKAGRDGGQLIGAGYNVSVINCSATNVAVSATEGCTHSNAGGNIHNEFIGRVMG